MRSEGDVRYFHGVVDAGVLTVAGDLFASFGHRLPGKATQVEDGIWCAWAWDGEHLTIESCRYGMYPLFVAQRPGEICVSNSISSMLARCSGWGALDDDAIATFLRIGYFLEDDTPYLHVRNFPPCAKATWNGIEYQLQAQRPITRAARSGTDRSGVETYSNLFASSVARRVGRHPVTLPLSGGRDSRHILFELCARGRPPAACVSAELPPPRTNEDLFIAHQLCNRLQLPLECVHQRGSFVRAAHRKNIATNFCSDEHTWAMPLVDHCNRRPRTLFDGIGGDVLSAGLFSTAERIAWARKGQVELLASDLLGDSEQSWRAALTPQAQKRFSHERARDRVVRALRPHLDEPNPMASFHFWNRTRREIALFSFGMYRQDSTVFAPYLDHELFDFLIGIPAELMLDKSFHSRTISHAYPDWADIPYSKSDYDPHAQTWSNWRRRMFHSRLAAEFGVALVNSDTSSLRRLPLVARLANLAGHLDPDRYWFDIERILWLTQLEGHLTH